MQNAVSPTHALRRSVGYAKLRATFGSAHKQTLIGNEKVHTGVYMHALLLLLATMLGLLHVGRTAGSVHTSAMSLFVYYLERRATASHTIVMALLSEKGAGGYDFTASWLAQWECSLRRTGLAKHFIIIAMDDQALHTCQNKRWPAVNGARLLHETGAGDSMSRNWTWIDYTLAKPVFALMVLNFNFSVLWSDLDIIYQRNPLAFFEQPAHARYDWQSGNDGQHSSINTGLYFARPTMLGLASVKKWAHKCMRVIRTQNSWLKAHSDHDQNVLLRMLKELRWNWTAHSSKYILNGGDIQKMSDVHLALALQSTLTTHINCIWGAEEKVVYARKRGLWPLAADGACLPFTAPGPPTPPTPPPSVGHADNRRFLSSTPRKAATSPPTLQRRNSSPRTLRRVPVKGARQ